MEKHYWPFDVLPVERQTEVHKREIRFLEAAHQQGLRSYEYHGIVFGAEADGGREGVMFQRGTNRWEVSLGTSEKEESCVFYQDFDAAADAILQWLSD